MMLHSIGRCLLGPASNDIRLIKSKSVHINIHLQQGFTSCFRWLDIIFNMVDRDRRKIVGPDRSCAEWLLRNGAGVRFLRQSDMIRDYNLLPSLEEGRKVHGWYIEEIDSTDSSIRHNGFAHLEGCEHISKINLNKCSLLGDEALKRLHLIKKSLRHLHVTHCYEVTHEGILSLTVLSNLQTLVIRDLPRVKNKAECKHALVEALKNCDIHFDP